jgi:hypothetical protein
VWVARSADLRPHDGDLPMVGCAAPGFMHVVAGSGPSACADAGLSPLPGGWEETVARWDAAHDAFTRRAFPETSGSCTDPQTAIRVVREELEAHGFTAWTVVDSFDPNSPNGQCAAYSSNFKDMQVIIVNDTVS